LNKIKTIIENPIWSFIGTVLGILVFFGFRVNMITHTVLQYVILVIALLLAIHGCFRLWKRKDNIKTKKEEPLPQKLPEYDILDDCIFDAISKWYINPITDEIFCFKCWHDNKSKIPIAKDGINLSSWICPKCNKPYTSPRTIKKIFLKNPRATVIGQRPEK